MSLPTHSDFKAIVKARVLDAEALIAAHRYDGAVYICGYAVEIALKARAMKVLKWANFPPNANDYKSFMTHKLEVLANLAGRLGKIRQNHSAEWSTVVNWNPESRYSPVGAITQQQAEDTILAVKTLVKAI